MLIMNQTGKVLIIREKGEKETIWKFPQGGVEKNESEVQTIARELKEEVNIQHYQIIQKAKYTHRYDWPTDIQQRKGFRGQEQSIYLILAQKPKEARCGEEKIEKLEWVDIEEAINRFTFENKISATKIVWKEFEPAIAEKNTPTNGIAERALKSVD